MTFLSNFIGSDLGSGMMCWVFGVGGLFNPRFLGYQLNLWVQGFKKNCLCIYSVCRCYYKLCNLSLQIQIITNITKCYY